MAKRKSDSEGTDLGEMNMTVVASTEYHLAEPEPYGVKFWHNRGLDIPAYATEFAAGFDIRASLVPGQEVMVYDSRNTYGTKSIRTDGRDLGRLYIEPGERVLVPTGLHADIPEDFYIAIHSRSGTSWKQGLILTNGAGVVDADYVDEIKISLTNNSGARVYIEDGDRIAQGILKPVVRLDFFKTTEKPLPKTSRSGGFGSTGSK